MSATKLPIDSASGRPLAWFPDQERYDKLRSFCARHQSAARAFRTVEVPKNLRYDWLQIEDQGQMGACQGHDLSTCCEVIYNRAAGKVIQLSRLWAYLQTQKIDGLSGRDCGSTIDGGVTLATTLGIPEETVLPYSDRYPGGSELQRILSIPGDARYQIRSGFRVESAEHAKQCIAGGMAITMGISWPPPFDSRYVIRQWIPGRQGGHAIAHCEITDGLITGQNSWSRSWGVDGRFFWTDSAFNACLRDPMTVAIALSDLTTPAPRRIDFAKELFS